MENDNKVKIILTENKFLDNLYWDPISNYRKGSGYYLWGTDNLMPEKIIDLKNQSPTHNSLIDLKIYMLNDWEYEGDEYDKILFDKYNRFTFDSIVNNIINDYVIFNQFLLKILPTESSKKLIEFIPIKKFRYGTKLNEDGDPTHGIISNDWSNLRLKENKKIELPIFKWKNSEKEILENTLYLYRDDVMNGIYQVPTYFSAINHIMLEDEIGKFNIANTKNGWAPRLIITLFGSYNNEELYDITRLIDSQYRGSENAGRVAYLTAVNPDMKPLIETISPDLNDDNYLNLVETSRQYICSAHKVTSPTLAGLNTSTGFQETGPTLKMAYTIYDELVISSYRKNIEREINKILELCGWKFSIKMKLKTPNFPE